jgi:hypothetical protein
MPPRRGLVTMVDYYLPKFRIYDAYPKLHWSDILVEK